MIHDGASSQAEEARALSPLLHLAVGDAGEQGRPGQTPEARRRQVLLGGGEPPTHVRPTGATLSNGPGVAESKE